MAPITVVSAQALRTENWTNWNSASSPVIPAENWMRYETPEEAGWSSEKLSSVQEMSNRARSAAVMVIYNGAILAQWGQTDRRFKTHSVAKSILSALYGIAVNAGDIDLDETIGSIGIDDITPLTNTEKSAKVSDLLKARSGVYHPAAYETRSMKERRPERGSHKPGTHWYYNNWDFNTLATIYNNKTSDDMFKAFEKQLAVPLKMQDFELRHTYYHLEPENSRHPAYPFRMSAQDLARIGLLFLNEGRWMRRQVIPSEWVHESTRPHSTYSDGGYGYMWWTLPERGRLGKLGTYAAFGYGGHAIYVVPEAILVFVHRANTYDRRKHVVFSAIENILLGVLQARAGPPLPAPKLIPVGYPQTDTPRKFLSEAQISGLAGQYILVDEVVTISDLDGRLVITNPYTGSFFLFPKTATEFEIEDEERRLEFSLDITGRATALQIWIRPDESYEFHRIGDENNKR